MPSRGSDSSKSGGIAPFCHLLARHNQRLWRSANRKADYLRFLAFGKIALGISIEGPSLFGILPEMAPRFSEMNKVRVICEQFGKYVGYVIASQLRDARWIYKISISEDPSKSETFDNWIPDECLELAR